MRVEETGRLVLLTMFILIFAVCAVILLTGLALAIFYGWTLPDFYIYAFGIAVLEPITFLTLWMKNAFGLRTTAKVKKYNSDEEINNYMKELISSGSTLDIVSGRLHWVSEDVTVKKQIINKAKAAEINIYLPKDNQIAQELRMHGINVHIVPMGDNQHARFTLVDKNRPGSAVLAVGYGRLPDFTISEFHEKNDPQVVALARDYLNKLI